MATSETRLARAARDRAGTYDRAAALQAGLSDGQLGRRVRAGVARRLANGRFALAGAPATWHQELHAAQLGIGSLGGIAFEAAAALWGLTGYDPGPVEVLVPVGAGSRNPLATVHRSRNVDERDFTRRDRLAVTTPERTLVDLASTEADRVRFLSAFDDAICRHLTTPMRVARTAERVIRGPRPGAQLIDAGLSCWPQGPDGENFGEMSVVRLLTDAGYPPPVRQHRIFGADGRLIAKVDCAYPWARLVIERDSERWHSGNRAVARDVERELRLQAAGWVVRRVTRRQVADGGALFLAAVEPILRPHLEAGRHLRQSAS